MNPVTSFKCSLIGQLILALCLIYSFASQAQQKTKPSNVFETKLDRIKRDYRRSEISDRDFWFELAKAYHQLRRKSLNVNPSELLQTQAYLLRRGGYPLLSARYASRAILAAEKPFAKTMEPSWQLLDKISKRRQIHDILIELGGNLGLRKETPPLFGGNWHYFVGEGLLRKNKIDQAIRSFQRIGLGDRYYLAARYQLAMSYLFDKDDLNRAGIILKSMAAPEIKAKLDVSDEDRRRYLDHAFLALGRLQYERQRFPSSVKYFRRVDRSSPFYYNALFEQAWSFFLGGYPNHALGSLHSVESPYFEGRFNPEIPVLRSIIYYWMCRYADAKAALAEFIEKYSEPVNNLEGFLDQKTLNPQKAYLLFENLITGVSDESLGIERDLLEHVAKSEPMVYIRDRLATVVAERDRLRVHGIFGSKQATKLPQKLLDDWTEELSKELGTTYIAELEAIRDAYREFRSQANFIYIELLMSEKEQALGRELHASAKIDRVNLKKRAKGWGRANVPWRASDKGEYWWDEIGFYVYQVEPRCNQLDQGDN